MSQVLDSINTAEDVRGLSSAALDALCAELRAAIIDVVSRNGGHLASNLGVVELTVALLRVFTPPTDRVVWDVGHQSYAYKLLTGRRDRFGTLRCRGGLSGFQRRDESPCDAFGAGHAGTALSAALGMAVARDREGAAHHVVAVVGDGAMGCGLSLEALNNLQDATGRLVVILNDNEMSIAENVGSISRYLGRLLASPRYNRLKRAAEGAGLKLRMGVWRRAYYRIEEAVKSLFLRSVLFEEFGLRYIGPIDGHDIGALENALTIARQHERPILVHVSTRKGRGYAFAERQPEKWHGGGCFDVASGQALSATTGLTWSQVFGAAMLRLAAQHERLVAITAAMPSGTGLSGFARAFPDRYFDVGICEGHAVTFAAGLAAEGWRPVFAVYSTFVQRAVDGIIHDVCLQNLPVVFCLDRAGVVGDDGPTHHGVFDIALLRAVPNLVIMQPADEPELCAMLALALAHDGPVAIRYPRGCGPGRAVPEHAAPLPLGRADVRREGADVALWALGDMTPTAERVAAILSADGIRTAVVNARFVAPLDTDTLARQAAVVRLTATIENGVAQGGFGSAVMEALDTLGYRGGRRVFGWPRAFVGQGTPDELLVEAGLTPEAIAAELKQRLA